MERLAKDTRLEAEEVQLGIWRSWTPEKRLESACRLLELVRRRVEQAIRDQHPGLSDDEVRLHFLRRAYGEEIAARVARYQNLAFDA
jgi:hypothetical protein